jgi:uncharacterized protein (TIGR03118 family)
LQRPSNSIPVRQEEIIMQFRRICILVPALILVPLAPTLTFAQHYIQTNLVSDLPGMAPPPPDLQLLNPWGMARSTDGFWWISDNNAGVSTIYDGTGAKQGLIVTIPSPPSGAPPSAPTGVVFSGSPTDFLIATGTPAHFIFDTEDGTISAWGSGSKAMLEVDNSPNAVYKGLTTADVNGVRYLYATNFRSGKVEIYDTHFKRVKCSGDEDDHNPFHEDCFDDDSIPPGFAPFNVQNIGGSLFVTYAKQNPAKHDDVPGDGLGYVDIYSPTGQLEKRLEHGPWLNAPWGVVWTPRDFGEFSNRILVGNFGSGWIAAYNGFNGKFIGFMKNFADPVHMTGEQLVTIDGLWALTFGNSAGAGPYNSLFFTAGINGEHDGLFGTLTPVDAEQDGDEE